MRDEQPRISREVRASAECVRYHQDLLSRAIHVLYEVDIQSKHDKATLIRMCIFNRPVGSVRKTNILVAPAHNSRQITIYENIVGPNDGLKKEKLEVREAAS